MQDRTIAPTLIAIDHIDFTAPKTHRLSNSVNLYHMNSVPNETSRFDLYFDAGKCRGAIGIAGFVNGLLFSGTEVKSSIEISNEINALGGFLETGISVENAVVSIYCLRENLVSIFKVVIDAIQNASFDEKEVKEFLSDRKQNMMVSMEKVGYLAQREFQQKLFASNESYSKTVNLSDFESVSQTALKEFHAQHYLKGLLKIVVVGNLPDKDIGFIKEKTRSLLTEKSHCFDGNLENKNGSSHINKEGALQCALRIGRTLFNKKHEDYLDFLILNTILGDYFGSRLMTNIREEKGYTYGVGTMIAELHQTGYFLIATEVGKKVKDDTINEIKYELNRLQNEKVKQDELQLVKNYMLGQLLKSADGPYSMTDLFLSAEMYGKDLEFYNEALVSIQKITAERIQELALKYLNWDDMTIVSAG
jgi:predicted Zn-dependent peptidase